MSTLPDPAPDPVPDSEQDLRETGLTPAGDELHTAEPGDRIEAWPSTGEPLIPRPSSTSHGLSYLETYTETQPAPPRFPNMLDVALMGILLFFAWVASIALAAAALHVHLFGVSTEKQAMTDVRYTLGAQATWYVIALALWILLFPAVWHKGFFAGVEWGAAAALRRRWQLFSAAFACFMLAIVDGVLLPGPKEAPIDDIFRMPGAAWVLLIFGVTMAPFIEEIIFRGFLLPALCTAWDWLIERMYDRPPLPPDQEGRTKWSLAAMVFASVATSVPFALMHGYQTGYSLGPFLLLFCVSMALCWVRLGARSLAASTVVHACYNLLLFGLIILGTGGFKHLDKL